MSWMERSCFPFLSQVRNATAGNSAEITLTKRLRIPQILCRPGWTTMQSSSRKHPRRSGWIGKDQSSPVWISFIVTPTQSPLSIPRTERGRKVHKTRNNKHANYSHLLISIQLPMEGWSERKNEPLGSQQKKLDNPIKCRTRSKNRTPCHKTISSLHKWRIGTLANIVYFPILYNDYQL